MSDENSIATLERLQQESFNYFLHETNPANGLVIDKNEANWPASITATGLALAAYSVAVERGFMPRAAAGRRTLNILRFFWNSPQGPERDATGYKGFYYHFLDAQSSRHVWQCELSKVDNAFLLIDAELPIHRSRLAASGICRGLVMNMVIGDRESGASGNVRCTEASSAR
jgi:hypothetical protein